ncbi:Small-conductance mechanosensitive channel [Chitinophaga jiangningensis]|uniref:Small-conductance mechanosensitive channel n=1 Tax=Chitinophaga jiangningensis TaxID=1419482 RepID=A0A1M7CMY9_9BACT|nr:mechanosensitive ion channel domain-containing protein [Chitinophaga jiangningensis]SHL68555.1 Small-conductance mechanosensitive channel [Chitinophaga jiangningensis]
MAFRILRRLPFYLVLVCCLLLRTAASGAAPKRDTTINVLDTLRKVLQKEAVTSVETYKTHQVSVQQDALLEALLKNIRSTRDFLKAGIDTNGINRELKDLRAKYNIAVDGILINQGSIQTERNLTTSYKLLHELLSRAQKRNQQAAQIKSKLVTYRNNFDSLGADSRLYMFSKDSAEFMGYMQQLVVAATEVHPIDSTLTAALKHIGLCKMRADLLVYQLQSALEQIDQYERQLSANTFTQEVNYLNNAPLNARPFREILSESWKKEQLILSFYLRNNATLLVVIVLLLGFAVIFLRSLRNKVRNGHIPPEDQKNYLVLKMPVVSAWIVVLSIFQFIFPNPPFIFSAIIWVSTSVCLTILFASYITRYWMVFWVGMWLLFILACADNLVLQASRTERWIMLSLALAGAIWGLVFLLKGRREVLREKAIIYFITYLVIIECLSVLANVYGRYNLSKSLLTSGFISVIVAITFLWTVRLINEALTLASDIFEIPERRLFFINFDVVGKKAPTFLYVFLVIGWFILFARNFYAFKLVTAPILDFLFQQRTLGSYNFSFFNLLAFFGILILSSVVSRIVSFFASDTPNAHGENKPGLGSWLLLIRISIIVLGVLLAFAATGIPLDQAMIVLGALGVGVGFGLQTIVHNLVSGVILAFEKPINVGDMVEVKGKTGTIKNIGFRSSVLESIDGSQITIPNGELLNDHLVNWSKNNALRRSEIVVGVAYDTDLKAAEKLLLTLMQEHPQVVKLPAPLVFVNAFDESAIQLQLYFWTIGVRTPKAVKSQLIMGVQQLFKENGISIPYPQSDLHIFNTPPPEK